MSARPNPGSFDKLCEEVKGKLAERNFVAGGLLYVNKPIVERFQVSHIFNFGEAKQVYQFGATYVGPVQDNKSELTSSVAPVHSPILFGQIDHEGALRAQIIHNHSKNFKTNLSFESTAFDFSKFRATAKGGIKAGETQQTQQISTLTAEYCNAETGDFVAHFQIVEPSLVEGSGVVIASFMQSLTSKLALGSQFIYQKHGALQQAQLNFGGKYTTHSVSPLTNHPSESTLHVLLGGNGVLNLAYARTLNKNISLISDYEANIATAESKLAVGYKFALTTQTVLGSINTNGEMVTILENIIAPGINFNICGKLDYLKGKSSFGLGFYIGGN